MDSSAPVKDKPNSEQRLGPQHETTEDTITRPSTAAAHTHGSGRSIGPQQSSEYACTSREDLQECSNTQSHELGQSNPSPSQPAEDCDPVPESFAQCKHWCTSAEPEETPDESPPQEEGSCDPCCECGENCHHNPFTDAVNLSVEKCLDKQECSFDRPNGEGLACCCMSCGASKAASRCSRCRQVRYCGRSCQEADWETHQHFCQTLRSQEIQQAFQEQMEKQGAEKSHLQPFIESMRAEIESALLAKDTLKAGFAQLFLSGALSTLDHDSVEAETALMCAADAGKETGDWKLEQQALQGLVAQRKQWDVNGAGATAVSKLLDRSQLKQDMFAEQSAMTHCGILQTYTDLLSGPHSDDKTRQIFESGINFLHQSIGSMFFFQRDLCKWVEDFPDPKAAAGAARLMHTINMCMCGTPCPHVALAWMEQSRHDNLVQLYRANMNKGDRAAAKEVLAALDIHCSGPEHGAYVKGCIANGNEVQEDEACWQDAAQARNAMLQLLAEASRSVQDTCSICLDELNITAATGPDPKSRIIVLLPCMHCFHLECVSRWRLNSRRCPLCQNDLHTLDQMLFAGKHINGADSQFGRLCEPLKEPHNPMPGSQPELLSLPAGTNHDLAVRLMEMLQTHNLLPDMGFPDLQPQDPGQPAPP